MLYCQYMEQSSRQPRRIGIDARFYGPLGKGLGRYTKETVDHILEQDPVNEYVIFLGRANFDELETANPRVKKVLADVRWYGLAEQLKMPGLIRREKLDLMHFPHFNIAVFCPVKFVVTIHDLILTKFPTTRATTLGPVLYWLKNFLYKLVIRRAVRGAEKVIAVSEYTRQDIAEHFQVPAESIAMVYEGLSALEPDADSTFAAKLSADEVLSGYCILEPYLLYVGNAYPHKNLESLILVFKQLQARRPDLKLVLVGKDDYFYTRLKAFAAEQGLWSADKNAVTPVIFPGYVPDRQLETLYARAAAYVFPSKYEGFGLPPLEAMARNCPVASSRETCLPEVLGDAALYFDPNDQADMARTISRLLDDVPLRAELRRKGVERSRLYSWERGARETIDVYQAVLDNPHG